MTSGSKETVSDGLRIASLLPSATAICMALDLKDYIVGITHECHELLPSLRALEDPKIHILTKNGLAVTEQGDIHQAVQDSISKSTCSRTKQEDDSPPSLYPLLADPYKAANPTVTFTQDLCSVCAPTSKEVQYLSSNNMVKIVSLQPTTLNQVAESFVTVADACGVPQRGLGLKNQWMRDFQKLQDTIQAYRNEKSMPVELPRMLILEWLDPPFDGGHWTYQMMDFACVAMAKPKDQPKSNALTWADVEEIDPDIVLIGCCGFDLKRNIRDAKQQARNLKRLRAVQNQLLFVCDGNRYIAQPGPSLLQGAIILAKCAYYDQPELLDSIDALEFFKSTEYNEDTAWAHLDLLAAADVEETASAAPAPMKTSILEPGFIGDIDDIEDLPKGFAQLHEEACQQGELTYEDPETGYSVFTELAHKKRGWCCGSGCRHCPYSHENVKDKATRIQQPAILYRHSGTADDFCSLHHPTVKVLFHSGGKDSFLTIRALVQQQKDSSRFGLVLLTTFDAATRKIAHQDIPIDDVIRQATTLDITLLGIPLRRSSGERYLERIRKGLKVIETNIPESSKITSLVFGDLHLQHIKDWRDNELSSLEYNLEYPLWNVPYAKLMNDLEASQVPCFISGSTVDSVSVGTPFTRYLYEKAPSLDLDAFGERGEFHSIAKVWEVPRSIALSL